MVRPPEPPLSAFERSIALWNRRGPVAYQFHMMFQTAWWSWEGVIRYEDGLAVIQENGKKGPPSSMHIIQPIESFFDLIRAAIEEEHVLGVAYDLHYGFPIAISDNWFWTFVDGPGERY